MTVNVSYQRGNGGITLTAAQLAQLEALRSTQQGKFDANHAALALGTPMYELLLSFISDEQVTTETRHDEFGVPYQVQTVTRVPMAGVDPVVWRWIDGATKVNSGTGFFADFIRDYTKIQYGLRGGDAAQAEALNQTASNLIAFNLVNDILGHNGNLPGITGLGAIDAGAAASTVFQGLPGSPNPDYSPWAGTLLFPYLGFDGFFKDLILNKDQVVANIEGKGTITVKNIEGTYDLFAAIQAARSASISAGISNMLEAIQNLFGPSVPDTDQNDLMQAATQFFRDYYGLDEDSIFDPGRALVFNGAFSEGGETYTVGKLGDDSGIGGGAGSDVINAGKGNDTILGSSGTDLIDGGEGTDTMRYEDSYDIELTLDTDLHGSGPYKYRVEAHGPIATDLIYGVERVVLGSGDDTLKITKPDASKLEGLEWIDLGADGGDEGDTLDLSGMDKGANVTDAGDSAVTLHLDGGSFDVKHAETIKGTKYDDEIAGGDGDNFLYGDAGDDKLDGGAGKDELKGGEGEDHLLGGDGDDKLYGEAGRDKLEGGAGKDRLEGGDDDDDLDGGEDDDKLYGGDGKDTLKGGAGKDELYGEAGDDTINGDDGDDKLIGDAGDDTLDGGAGKDNLDGGDGNDQLKGGDGDDTLDGGSGSDRMQGGTGFDSYKADATDVISDEDGKGTVKLDGTTLVGGTRKKSDPENQYKSLDGQYTYLLNGSTLVINGGLTINDYHKGDLGIRLETEDDPPPPPTHDPNNSVVRRDPLALDLDGDGKILTSAMASSNAYFDIDNDGIAEHTGWINPGDGLVVNDVNGNGSIDGLNELFGGPGSNGFEALRNAGDDNQDGRIDAQDAIYQKLRVWIDANQDGLSQAGELHTLQELGIDAIKLGYDAVNKDSNGNRIIGEGSFVRNGVESYAAAFDLQFDNRITKDPGSHSINQTVLQGLLERGIALPMLRGFGNAKDLQTVYAQDDQVLARVQSLAQAAPATVYAQFEWLMADWSGLSALRGQAGLSKSEPLSSAEKLWILEVFSGISQYRGVIEQDYAAHRNPYISNINAAYIDERFNALSMHFADRFLAQGPLGQAFAGTVYSLSSNKLEVTDAARLAAGLEAYAKAMTSPDHALVLGEVYAQFRADLGVNEAALAAALAGYANASIFRDLLTGTLSDIGYGHRDYTGLDGGSCVVGTGDNDVLRGRGGNDVLIGGAGDDTLDGGTGDDRLQGDAGNDNLIGGSGNDVLEGGAGNDVLTGGAGSDTYRFGAGFGSDLIVNYDPADAVGDVDAIVLDAGIAASSVWIERRGNDLLVHLGQGNDAIRVQGQFDDADATSYAVDQIRFADGTVWGRDYIKAQVQVANDSSQEIHGYATDEALSGGYGDDAIFGNDGNDTLHGDAGNDRLYGGEGNDVIVGDGGDDSLEGGAGSDIYRYALGDGSDTIYNDGNRAQDSDVLEFGEGILPGQVAAARQGDNLYLNIGADRLNLYGYFTQDAGTVRTVREIRFADGKVWSVEQIKAMVIVPNDSAQEIHGYATDDVLSAGGGDDQMYGKAGNDTLQGDAGNDRIYGEDGNDILIGGAGDDQLFGGGGNDTYRYALGDGSDTIDSTGSWGASNQDVLEFGAGIEAAQVAASRQSYDLLLKVGTDTLRVRNYFYDDANGSDTLQLIRFADGTSWTPAAVKAMVIAPSDAAQEIYGYANDDTLSAGGGDDKMYGYAGNDVLHGDDGNDRLDGGDGNDRLAGGKGNDWLYGGSGADIYEFNAGDGNDVIDNTGNGNAAAADALVFGSGILPAGVTVSRQSDNLVLQLPGGTDSVVVNYYFSNDAGTSNALKEIRFADGTSWNVDTVKAMVLQPTDASQTLYGYESADTIAAGGGDDVVFGNGGNDTLNGDAGNDSLNGGNGDDVLDGGAGNDRLAGGAGEDIYRFGLGGGNDVIDNSGNGTGQPTDTLVFGAGIQAANVSARRENDDLLLTVGTGGDSVRVSAYFATDASTERALREVRFADGTSWSVAQLKAMVLQGTADAQYLVGYASDDTIAAGGGNDVVYGRNGNDTLSGEDGNDQLYGEAGDDSLSGGAGDDSLDGGQGNDTLNGGRGTDSLRGGLGDDRYVYAAGDGNDVIVDADGLNILALQGINQGDLIMRRDGSALVIRFANAAGDSLRLEQYFDAQTGVASRDLRIEIGGGTWNLTPALLDVEAVKGSALADVIYGNTLANRIDALDGDDTVYAGAGDDTLSGGAGNDTLLGEAGNDAIDGGDGNDLLDGGAGQDRLAGGAGDDIYIVDDAGDTVTEQANGGDDLVRSSVTHALSANVERLELTGVAAIDGTGNALDNTLTGNGSDNRLDGGDGNDTLYGNGGNDTLIGGAGDDQLDGGWGSDALRGGTGDDTYFVDATDDVIVELAGEGHDVVYASSSYVLSDNIEKLVLTQEGWAADGTGNAGDNDLVGNAQDNRLDGGAGADTMTGGLGNDTYVVDQAGDVIVELEDEGNDTVESSISYTLGATLENLVLTGSADIDGLGNDQDNLLVGNDGNNRLEGGLGNDTLAGGLGDDYYIEESSGDRVRENADEGIDTVERRYETNLILAANVDKLLLAAGIQTGNGNGLDNVITGNAGANKLAGLDGDDVLYGLDGDDAMWGGTGTDQLYGGNGNDYLDGEEGADRLEGGAGNDIYIVDDANDVVVEAAGGGADQVQATVSATLAANVENLFLMGTAAIDGTGNELDNYIAGNGADNKLYGMGGNDTMVAGAGNDTLVGGTGDDKYVFDASSGSDVVDNTGGGNDGVFFTNGITRDKLSFSRDGNDLLIFVSGGATPAVRVTNHFLGGDAAIDYVQPDGGFSLTTAEINQIVAGGSTGGQYDQVIDGTAAGEQLVGSSGKDLVRGLGGNDTLFGMGGNDTLQGGDGDDYLAGGNGSGSGSGDDRLEGGIGNDQLNGEDGNNTLIGGAGDDKYVYGGGKDVIDNTGGGFDGVFFNNGITAAQLTFTRSGDDLVITVGGDANKTVTVTGHFLGGDAALDYVQPASGSMLDTAAINALVGTGGNPGGGTNPGGGGSTPGEPGNDADYTRTVTGTAAGEQLVGNSARDLIKGLGGNDTLFGMGGDDKLVGGDGDDYLSGGNGSFSGSGNDILVGGNGNDTLVGEDGNDYLQGGAGDDQYVYRAANGKDVIDNAGGGTDWLIFDGVNRSRLSFHRSGDDLIVLVDGDSNQQVRVQNHFLGGDKAIAYVQPADGNGIPASAIGALLKPLPTGFTPASTGFKAASLEATDVAQTWQAPAALDQLVQAMAQFGGEDGGVGLLPEAPLDLSQMPALVSSPQSLSRHAALG
ncbi:MULTISPECIES: calcium-binding protein [unclassified Dyella]|uniref:calcium-binding protein n=1 Tax=unclassified Dyella TaxID=2634549 RepID=UPI0025475BD4|nr:MULTISPECIES: calcium-binding protein [unclassified Dyella]